MKKYFLHDGTSQQGPFDIEELKSKNIHKDSQVWFEGQEHWTNAGNIEELKPLFANVPPPFERPTQAPPPITKVEPKQMGNTVQPAPKKSNKLGKILQGIGAVGALLLIAFLAKGYMEEKSYPDYQTAASDTVAVMTVEEIESSQPTDFLTATGNYDKNFWGDKIRIHGNIVNKATVTTYKDAVIKVTYFSKTQTELGSKEYTIYEMFAPNSTKPFELKVDNFRDVESIGVEVTGAVVR